MFCLRNYWSPAFALVRERAAVRYPGEGATVGHPPKFNSVVVSLILLCGMRLVIFVLVVRSILILIYLHMQQVCGARGPRPRYPRVWKTRKKIGTISKSQKLVECVRFF